MEIPHSPGACRHMEGRIRFALLGIRPRLNKTQDMVRLDAYLACLSPALVDDGPARLPDLQLNPAPSKMWVLWSEITKAMRLYWIFCRDRKNIEVVNAVIVRLENYARLGWVDLETSGSMAKGFILDKPQAMPEIPGPEAAR